MWVKHDIRICFFCLLRTAIVVVGKRWEVMPTQHCQVVVKLLELSKSVQGLVEVWECELLAPGTHSHQPYM